jgi:hypothetical protein
MAPPDQPRRPANVRTRTRPAAVSENAPGCTSPDNVVPFRPRPIRATREPEPPLRGRAARLHDTARRCALAVSRCGVVTVASTGQVLFEMPGCLDSKDGTLLVELFLGLYERALLSNRAGGRGESR